MLLRQRCSQIFTNVIDGRCWLLRFVCKLKAKERATNYERFKFALTIEKSIQTHFNQNLREEINDTGFVQISAVLFTFAHLKITKSRDHHFFEVKISFQNERKKTMKLKERIFDSYLGRHSDLFDSSEIEVY